MYIGVKARSPWPWKTQFESKVVSDGDDECYETVDPSLTARSIVQQSRAACGPGGGILKVSPIWLSVDKLADNMASVRLSCPNFSCSLTLCSVNNDTADLA